jgi:hypothetical protein
MKCLALYTVGRKKGKPCEQRATTDGYCGAHAPEYKAERMRVKGLRTVAKPGDPDFKVKVDKPFCDDREIEGLNETQK